MYSAFCVSITSATSISRSSQAFRGMMNRSPATAWIRSGTSPVVSAATVFRIRSDWLISCSSTLLPVSDS